MTVRILKGDCRDVLRSLPDESVHCVVTSPPYWGLRDYGVAGQIGLEGSFAGYVEIMRNVFGEVRRVLRSDGTLWLNLGDSYANDGKWGGETGGKQFYLGEANRQRVGREKRITGLKAKDLVGIPWRVAFALQADGWYLRSDIIWSKPNPMPESVTDRPTKAHEYLFLLTKAERYFYDAGAIKEPVTGGAHPRTGYKMPDGWDTGPGGHGSFHRNGREKGRPGVTPKSVPAGLGIKANESFHAACVDLVTERNKRSVWEIATEAFPEAHFATFPAKLVEPCIAAGCPVGGTVLDPFGGAGTVGMVADRLGRNAILIELNPQYAEMAERRLRNDAGMFAQVAAE